MRQGSSWTSAHDRAVAEACVEVLARDAELLDDVVDDGEPPFSVEVRRGESVMIYAVADSLFDNVSEYLDVARSS